MACPSGPAWAAIASNTTKGTIEMEKKNCFVDGLDLHELLCYILNHSARMVRRKIRIMSDRVLVIFNPRSSLLIRVYSPFNPITAVHTAVSITRPYQVPYYPVPSRYSSTCTSWVLRYSPVPSRYVLSSEYDLLVPTSLNPLPYEYERYYY